MPSMILSFAEKHISANFEKLKHWVLKEKHLLLYKQKEIGYKENFQRLYLISYKQILTLERTTWSWKADTAIFVPVYILKKFVLFGRKLWAILGLERTTWSRKTECFIRWQPTCPKLRHHPRRLDNEWLKSTLRILEAQI